MEKGNNDRVRKKKISRLRLLLIQDDEIQSKKTDLKLCK